MAGLDKMYFYCVMDGNIRFRGIENYFSLLHHQSLFVTEHLEIICFITRNKGT
jgi:hypothetical protein